MLPGRMVGRMLLVAVAVAGLGGAGVGGAVVVGNTTSIARGQWAHLEGTKIYCEAYLETSINRSGFDCGYWLGAHRAGNSFSMVIDELGVEVDRWDSAGRNYRRVKTYLNP